MDRRTADSRSLWIPLAVAVVAAMAFRGQATGAPLGEPFARPPGAALAAVWVNGRPLPDAGPSFVWDGTVMTPARAFEALGARVQWRAQERAVRIQREELWAEARVGQSEMATARGPVSLPRPATLLDGRLVVPARAVGEALGFEVRWDAGRQLVHLLGPPQPPQRPAAAGPPAAADERPPGPAPREDLAAPVSEYRPSPLPPLPPQPDDPTGLRALVSQLPLPIPPEPDAPLVVVGHGMGQASPVSVGAGPGGTLEGPHEAGAASSAEPASSGQTWPGPEYRPTPLDARIRALPDLPLGPEGMAPGPQLAADGVRLPLAPEVAVAPAYGLFAAGTPAGLWRAAESDARPAAPPAPAGPLTPPVARAAAPEPGGSAEEVPAGSPGGSGRANRAQVLGIDVRRTGGRARVDILRDGPVALTQPAILADPPRLVFDLGGAELAAPSLEYDVDGPILKRVRLGQQAPDVVRVALDLNTLVGYSLTDGPESTTVLLNHQVSSVYWIPDARAPAGGQLWIEMSGYAPVRTASLDNPRRLVVDIQEATLTAPSAEWSVASGPVTRIRVSQHQPDVVRVVLELAAPVQPRIVTSADLARRALLAGEAVGNPLPSAAPGSGGRRAVAAGGRTSGDSADRGPSGGGSGEADGERPAAELEVVLDVYSRIRRVALSQLGRSGVSLVVEGTAPIEARTFYLRDPDRLVVDLPGAVLEPSAGGPRGEFPGAGPVRSLRTGQFLPRSARIVVELEQAVAHRVFRTEEGTTAVVALGTEPLAGRTVALDPGHGGSDTGAVGASGTPEKFYNLDIARRLARLLQSLGVEVTLTRTDDVFVSLDERVEMARVAGAEALVSIHNNASPSAQARGTEVLYAPRLPESRRLAQLLYEELVSRLGTQGRGLKARRDLRVLRLAPMPAALVEVAFVDHPGDERRLADPAFRQQAAEALFSAIVGYFSSVGNDTQEAAPVQRPGSSVAGRAR